jgi:hypothetical protein
VIVKVNDRERPPGFFLRLGVARLRERRDTCSQCAKESAPAPLKSARLPAWRVPPCPTAIAFRSGIARRLPSVQFQRKTTGIGHDRLAVAELAPPHRIVEANTFVTSDLAFLEMAIVVTFEEVSGRSEVRELAADLRARTTTRARDCHWYSWRGASAGVKPERR